MESQKRKFGESQKLADRLEACNIITGTANVPEELGTYGLRLGVQEVTRRGMTEADAPDIADCIINVLNGHELPDVKQQVIALVQRFNQIRFTLGHI